jgi:hypothetical protein
MIFLIRSFRPDGAFKSEGKHFFFEKKKQKTFDSCGIGDGQRQVLQ